MGASRWLAALLLTALAGCAQSAEPRRPPVDANGWFWVYNDQPDMPFTPYGYMPAEAGQMARIDWQSTADPADGQRCVAVEITWRPPGWLGVAAFSGPAEPAWWGDDDRGQPYDLSGFGKLVLWARGAQGGERIRVALGTLAGKPHGDSLPAPLESDPFVLTTTWQRYELDLRGQPPAARRAVVSGFTLLLNQDQQPGQPAVTRCWLDRIGYEPLATGASPAPVVSAPATRPAPAGLARLREALRDRRFIAYTPTNYHPDRGVAPSDESLRADFATLRPYFDGIVTYGAGRRLGGDRVLRAAAAAGMLVIAGLWNPADIDEQQVVTEFGRAHPEQLLAVLVGNETQLFKRCDLATLQAGIARLQEALPGVPVSTSEPVHLYSNAALRDMGDFLAPIIHWVFAGPARADVRAGVAWTAERVRWLRGLPGAARPVLVKESGLPSGPAPLSATVQAAWWEASAQRLAPSLDLAVVAYEAFDMPWKVQQFQGPDAAMEDKWGLWQADRTPKPVVTRLPRRDPRP
ncbi:MAG: hypothetical protein IT204_09285 [Fimbriimonadaceae bacterium]|nr:hypothetical protein [Fimbriimonadaceae bacterium]